MRPVWEKDRNFMGERPQEAWAVSGAAAAYDLPLDALEDLREAALEAFSALTESADEGAQGLHIAVRVLGHPAGEGVVVGVIDTGADSAPARCPS